ncbi:MAG: GIY-YIG nuclease family protein [Candidatus Limnocylindrales bacterium]
MTSKDRRGELRSAYEQRQLEAGVYALRNTVTGRLLIASSTDLASVRNRLAFGQSTESTGVLDRRLVPDARRHGMASFCYELLDLLDATPDRDAAQTAADLSALEQLCREKLADQPQY